MNVLNDVKTKSDVTILSGQAILQLTYFIHKFKFNNSVFVYLTIFKKHLKRLRLSKVFQKRTQNNLMLF